MVQSGTEDDFYAYTQEWTTAINRGEVCIWGQQCRLHILWQLDMLTRKLLSQHLVSGTGSQDEVTEAVVKDQDLLFWLDILTGWLLNERSASVLKQVIILWMTICVHALAKPLTKQCKYDNEKGTSKKKALKNELSKAQ